MMILKQALAQSHEYARIVVNEGDTVVDATMGNGNDTVFLAELVGKSGKVYAFDIQCEALKNTSEKLSQKNLEERCVLISDSHDKMADYVKEPVRLVMFNLGYRPGGDHSISTTGETTMRAVHAAMEKLAVHGLIIIVIYHGGDTGFAERDYILNELPKIKSDSFAVMLTSFLNLPNYPPMLVCIEKLK